MKSSLATILFLFFAQSLVGQLSFNGLLNHRHFNWTVDSTSTQLILYYQANGWTSQRVEKVKRGILTTIDSVKKFIGITEYNQPIHFFIVESKDQMKDLLGRETNGAALPKYNTVTGIGSEKIRSIFSNHEVFHLIATNLWGEPEVWINEGMAVYADNGWNGYDLHQLTKYLNDHGRSVPLEKLLKKFKKIDSLIAYPLIGSFTKYLEETYGREMILKIWQGEGLLTELTGKNLNALEQDWLTKISTVDYLDIKY